MMKIVAIFAVAFVFIASPASAGFTSIDLYWTVDIKGVIDSSTLEFDPDPSLYLYPNLPPPPSTSTCNSDCGTFEVQSTSYNDEYGGVPVDGKETLFLNGKQLQGQQIVYQDVVTGECDTDCPGGYTGVIGIENQNFSDGVTGIYGPYPGSGTIYAQYLQYLPDYSQSTGVYNYNAVYTTTSVSVVTNAVPEPSTWALLLLGFAGLGFASYRRARRSQKRSPASSRI